MKFRCCLLLLLFAPPLWAGAPKSETMTERGLRRLVERQRTLLESAAKGSDRFDEAAFKAQVQQLCLGYETFLRENPDYAAGYAAYGYLLHKVGMDKESAVMLLKANSLDADNPFVKNELGNYLAEQGRPLEAANYFLAAIKLAPNEPLYHYQLGTLLHEARDDFIKSGDWTADSVDNAMHEAFRKAAELAPDRIEYTYRYAESFYDMPHPDWTAALKAWGQLEEQAHSPAERQTMRLHAANIFIKMGDFDRARALLATVTEPHLAGQKQKLVAQLDGGGEK
jgi:tetratricopeptide (TPR) repeat protein